jgi:hypothetical protein
MHTPSGASMMLMLVMMGRQLGVADPRCSQNRNLSACEIQRKKKEKKENRLFAASPFPSQKRNLERLSWPNESRGTF